MSRFTVRRSAAIALVAAVAATGCAQNYASTLPASGEPLAYDWSTFRQGRDPIDEQDFYRIAGDSEAVTKIERTRSRGTFYNRAGWVLAAIGAAGLIVATATDSPGLDKL